MKKKLLVTLLCLTFIVPANAVFNEKNMARTLSVLRHELHLVSQEKEKQDANNGNSTQMAELQHREMVRTIKWINELTLILYSQDKGFTLDQTYAMDGVMYEYERFNKSRSPQLTNIGSIETEIERYQRLLETLRLLPPKLDIIEEVPDTLRYEDDVNWEEKLDSISLFLDSLIATSVSVLEIPVPEPDETTEEIEKSRKGLIKELALYGIHSKKEASDTSSAVSYLLSDKACADRDSCIVYTKSIINSYIRERERIQEEEQYFTELSSKLKQNYEYSQERFEDIKKYIFVTGQENYFYVLSHLGRYAADAAGEMEQKYGSGEFEQDKPQLRDSQWRGFGLAGLLLYSFWHILIIALVVNLLLRFALKNVKPFNSEWFKQTKPVTVLVIIAIVYSLVLSVSMFFPMSNAMNMAAILALVFLWFVIALLMSLLVSLKKEDVRAAARAFLPAIAIGFLTFLTRALFLPDKTIHLLLSPVLLIFLIWQIAAIRRFKSGCPEHRIINTLLIITAVVLGLALMISLQGFSLLALMFIMWWIFQVTAISTLAAIAYLMRYISETKMAKAKERYAQSHKMVSQDEDGDFIRVTWLFDFANRAVLPIAGIFSLLGCIWLASGVFNLTEACKVMLMEPFIDLTNTENEHMLQISLQKLASVSSYFFLFRYYNYLARSLYRVTKYEKMLKQSENDVIRRNDINLTLAYNIIGIIIWGLFAFYAIEVLKIPLGAISIVAAGLATGIGLALKDVLNNFIYGIQLMSGRLRAGDIVECDGVRGTVEKISYQSTEIQTLTGSVISFTNASLFNKNFQNLTKNSPYEYVAVPMSIPYGEDIEKVRSMITEALKGYLKKKDKYGRHLIDRKTGIWVDIIEFADSSINIGVKQMLLAEYKYGYAAEVRELLYNLFNENGIVIPFPQREVSILNLPENK